MIYADRVYDRDTVLWDWDDLHRLEAEGKAQRLVDHGLWIVKKDEGGQVVVRDSQVLVYNGMTQEQCDAEARAEQEAELAYERHLEDRGYWEARADEDYERQMGVIPFDEAMRQAQREQDELIARFSPPKED
jgi:hypothetical protein